MKYLTKIKNLFPREQRVILPEFPINILLEPTNACNLRCRMCPIYGEGVKNEREIGFIKKDLWEGIINELGSWPSHVNLDIHGAGEPLLHPNFLDIISHVKSKNNITVGFLCNGTLLDREKARAIVELNVDWVCFSVDGSEKGVFEYYRKGADMDLIEENIKHLISIRKTDKPNISLNMVRHEEIDIDAFIEKWAGIVDVIHIMIKRAPRKEDNIPFTLIKPCPSLYEQMVIGWPGKLGLCCEDYWGDFIVGEFPSQSLYEIWHGPQLQRARKLHEKGNQDKISLCKHCSFTGIFHKYDTRIIEKNGKATTIREELNIIDCSLAKP